MKAFAMGLIVLAASYAMAQVPSTDSMKNQMNAAQTSATTQTSAATDSAKAQGNSMQGTMMAAKQKVLVNLNTASKQDLAKLPGIGPARADAIIAARPYASIEDLKKVKGIKEGLIAKIKDKVTVQ